MAGDAPPIGLGCFPLEGMPAEQLYAGPPSGDLHIIDDVATRFPKWQELHGVAPQGYSAALFRRPDGRPAGHIFILDDRAVKRAKEAWELVALIGQRVGAEFSLRSNFFGGARLERLVDGTGTAHVVTDASGQIIFANDIFANWADFPGGADIVGSEIKQWIDPDARAVNRLALSNLLRRGTVDEYETLLIDRHGVRREVAVAATVDWTPAGRRIVVLMRDVKKRNDTERARLESETRFRNLIEGSLEGILISDEWMRPLFVNRMAVRMFGYDGPNELKALGSYRQMVASHELPRFCAWWRQILDGESVEVEQEFEGRREDGAPIWMRIVARRIEWDGNPAVQSTMLDITERHRAAEGRAEIEARLKAIIENAPFSIVLKDGEGRYVSMNRKGEEWLGTTIDVAAGRFPDAVHSPDAGKHERRRDLEVLNEGRIVSYEIAGEAENAHRTFWVTKFPVLGPAGALTGLGTIVSDISDRKQAENLLQRQIEEAEKSNDAKTRFLAAASHDLRQPLHSMELMLEILARIVQEPAQQELVSDIAQAANIAAGLLNPLLDYSRLEAGMVQPEIEDFSIASLLRDMDVRFRSQAENAGLELRIVPSDAVIRSDPVLLSLIVSNFLSNAVRYTEKGRLLLGCRRHGNALRIEVWDTGPGIDSKHLHSIFEEFHQLETVSRDRDKGLGLGLAIVKAQASLLQHEVRVATNPGRGSTFSIEVPLIKATEKHNPVLVADAVKPEFLVGLRMLILEDDPGIQRATKTLLERWGCNVSLAANGDEAMNVIADETAMFDLIIADYQLEHGDNGVDTVLQIQDRLDYDVPAIIVTADFSNESLRRADKNAFPVLQKPFRPDALRSAIACSILNHAAAS